MRKQANQPRFAAAMSARRLPLATESCTRLMPTRHVACAACVAIMFWAGIALGQPAGAAALDPHNPSLLLWLKADGVQGVGDGAKLAAWSDGSGKGHDVAQPTAANQPIYVAKLPGISNKPAVRFGGSDFLLSASNFKPNLPWSVFGVVRTAGKNPAGCGFQQWLSGGNNTIAFGVATAGVSDPKFSFLAWAPSRNCTYGVAHSLNNDWHIHAYIIPDGDNTHWQWYYDGRLTGAVGLTGDRARMPAAGISIGAQSGGIEGWYGDIAEIIVFGEVLSDGDRVAITEYLQAKYFQPRNSQGIGP